MTGQRIELLRDPLSPTPCVCYSLSMDNLGSLTHREYDRFMSPVILDIVRKRRVDPDGEPHKVYETFKDDAAPTYRYNWGKMRLGDFFIVPIGHRSEKAMRAGFLAASRRHDIELSVVKIKPSSGPGKGQDCLRVTLTYFGVEKLRQKARNGQ